MKTSLVLLCLIALTVIFVIVFNNKKPKIKGLYKAKKLMTDNEVEFFGRLIQALPGYYVFPQVAMGALIQPNRDKDHEDFWKIRGTVSQKITDFLVCDKTMKVIAIVELDDKTHDANKDRMRDEMTRQAHYKTIRWESKNKPSIVDITKTIISLK